MLKLPFTLTPKQKREARAVASRSYWDAFQKRVESKDHKDALRKFQVAEKTRSAEMGKRGPSPSAAARRDVYYALYVRLQEDLDAGSAWIEQDRNGSRSSEATIRRRVIAVKRIRDDMKKKSIAPTRTR